MALCLQSDTKLFSRQINSYVQIPMMTVSFPFGQYEEKKTFITGNVATYVLGYKIFHNKNSRSCMLKNTFPPMLVKKKNLHKRFLISICIN